MENNKTRFYKTKRFKVASGILASLMLTTTAVVLPTVFYGTANNLLYVDTFGKIQTRAPEEVAPPHNPYKGMFVPTQSYEKGDVVSHEEVVFHDDRLRDEVSTVTSTSLYEFTQNWNGDVDTEANFKEKTTSFDPFHNNYTTTTVPFDQLFTTTVDVDNMMGYSTLLNGIGRTSLTGKFDGAGAAYDPWDRPGFAYVQNDRTNENYNVTLTQLGRPFAWAKKATSVVDINYSGSKSQITTPSTLPTNAVPNFYENQENWFKIRNEYYNNGMVAYKFDNQGEITDLWRSDVKSDETYHYIDMIGGYPSKFDIANWIASADFALLSKINNDYEKTFNFDDDNLGLYIYSKASPYLFADRAATHWRGLESLKDGYSTDHGFYHGTGEPLIYIGDYGKENWDAKDSSSRKFHYLGRHESKRVPVYTRKGTINENMDTHQLVGAYMYSNTYQWPRDSDVINYNNDDYYGHNDDLSKPQVSVNGEIYSWLTGTPELILRNNARSFSYYNGVFSLNKPKDQLGASEQQEIRWYTPLASTDMQVSLNEEEIKKTTEKSLATEAMNTGNIAKFVNFNMYNAIPSSYYGGEVTMAADNVTGTIWLKFKSGPGVDVVNGTLFKKKQEASTAYEVPGWIAALNWTYYYTADDGLKTGSATWDHGNTTNPVMEIGMAEPLEYSIAITGYPEIKPTVVIDTTNPDGQMFDPAVGPADETKKYGPYRLTGPEYINMTPFEYVKQEDAKPDADRYSELLNLVFENLVKNKEPSAGFVRPDGKPFIEPSDLVMTSSVNPFNFYDESHPEWGGRIQFSVTLKKYFDKNGDYVDGSGGFEPKLVRFGGFKAVPGPTSITANYNLNSLIPGGATNFNKENLITGNGVNYPSDYLSDKLGDAAAGVTKYDWLADMVYRWSKADPFKGDNKDTDNPLFTSESYMIKNLPPPTEDPATSKLKLPFSLPEENVEFNNFTGLLKITPLFDSYYSQSGDLISGAKTTLGTITISGFQTVNGSTYIPNVVNAISTNLQPSAIVTRINGVDQTTPTTEGYDNYIGQELYKMVWNEAINLPTKDYDLPPYDESEITPAKLEEIRRVIDIRVKPNDRDWVDNVEGSLKFAVAFKKVFDKKGIPKDIPKADLWPDNWDVGGTEDDHVFLVTAYGYDNSPGPTSVLKVGDKNRDIVVNQPNYQPSEFIKNDAQAGYPLLKSLIAGNLNNLPKSFTTDDIVLDVEQFNTENASSWDPDPKPLAPNNATGSIKVTVYLKKYYNDVSKLCDYKEDNTGEPYTDKSGDTNWTFNISGFMQTNAKGASDLEVTDGTFPSTDKHAIDLADPKVYEFMKKSYPDIAALREKLPYQASSTTDIKNLISIKNKSSTSTNQPYLLMANIPTNIRPYNIIIDPANVVVNNKEGTLSFKVNLRQWFTNEKTGITYHPTLEDQSNGNDMYTTNHAITIKGMKKVNNATIIKPTGDNVDTSGNLTLSHGCTSEKIIKGVLKGSYLDAHPEATPEELNKAFADFDVTKIQPSQLDDLRLKEYLYVALIESGGSPYTLERGSMVINEGTADDPVYRIKDEGDLNEFISWKINPFYDLTEGKLILSPMLNIWFGGDDVQVFNQYQSFGGGDSGKPSVTKNADGSVSVISASVTQLTLQGFLSAKNTLQFNSAAVYDGQANVVLNNMDTTKITALEFANNGIVNADGVKISLQQALENKDYLTISPDGIIEIVGEPSITGTELNDINNLVDFSDKNSIKVNAINGTIEVKTKVLKYFDANKILQTGSINLVLTGFLPSTEAYQTTYIIVITTIIALIIILGIVLARILWVRYARTREEYKNN